MVHGNSQIRFSRSLLLRGICVGFRQFEMENHTLILGVAILKNKMAAAVQNYSIHFNQLNQISE